MGRTEMAKHCDNFARGCPFAGKNEAALACFQIWLCHRAYQTEIIFLHLDFFQQQNLVVTFS